MTAALGGVALSTSVQLELLALDEQMLSLAFADLSTGFGCCTPGLFAFRGLSGSILGASGLVIGSFPLAAGIAPARRALPPGRLSAATARGAKKHIQQPHT